MAVGYGAAPTQQRGYYLYLIPGALGFVVIVLGPQIANFVLSFTVWKGVGLPRTMTMKPSAPGIR